METEPASPPAPSELDSPPPPRSGAAWFFLDAERRLRTPFRLMIFGVGFLFSQIVLGVVVLVVMVTFLAVQGVATNRWEAKILNAQQLLMIVSALPVTLLMLGLVWVCRRFVDRRNMASTGFKPISTKETLQLPAGLLLGAGAIGLGWAIAVALGAMQPTVGQSIGWAWFATFAALVFMAFMEEIVFRGYVLQNFRDIGMTSLGVVLSSIGFWLAHSGNPAAWTSPWIGINLFGAGVVLSLAYIATDNIWFPTALHFAWNFMQGPILGIEVSGLKTESIFSFGPTPGEPAWISGGAFGLEGSALCALTNLLLCLILGVWILVQRKTDQVESTNVVVQ